MYKVCCTVHSVYMCIRIYSIHKHKQMHGSVHAYICMIYVNYIRNFPDFTVKKWSDKMFTASHVCVRMVLPIEAHRILATITICCNNKCGYILIFFSHLIQCLLLFFLLHVHIVKHNTCIHIEHFYELSKCYV